MKIKYTLVILSATAGLLGVLAFAVHASEGAAHGTPSQEMSPDLVTEMKAFHEKSLATYDVNKNGTLDEDERFTLHDDVRSGKFPIPEAVRKHVTEALGHEGTSLPPEILAKYDTNKDGKLDKKEHVAFAVDVIAGKVQPPRPRHAGPAAEAKKAAPGP